MTLATEDVLQRSQLTTIYGGSEDGCPRFRCQCHGSIGTWEGTYCSAQAMANAIQTWCASGEGTCDAL